MKYISLLLCSLLVSTAIAETVYLNDGREIQGSVTRKGEQLLVTQKNGEVIRVASDAVLYIGGTTQDAETSPDDTAPDDSLDDAIFSSDTTGSIVDLTQVTMPEIYVWSFIRRDRPDLADRYRKLAHDRQRKIGTRWMGPEDFIRRRQAYLDATLEAQKTFNEAEDLDIQHRDPATRARNIRKQRSLMETGTRQLARAAALWTDPTLRRFLLGAAELQADDYTAASVQFQTCAREIPQVAAFHQGLGMAQFGDAQYDDALASFVTMLKLQPDAAEAAALLQTALAATPGQYIDRPNYRAAKELVDAYQTRQNASRRSRSGKTDVDWLLPGDVRRVDSHGLPTPTVDRYIPMQAIGVPVGKGTLLVEAAIVRNAMTLHVELPNGDLIAAELPRRIDTDVPAVLIDVPLVEFTPLLDAQAIDKGKNPKPPKPDIAVQVHGMNLMAEMGQSPRVFTTTVTRQAVTDPDALGRLTLAQGLLAGEAAGPVFDDKGNFLGILEGKTSTDPEKLRDHFLTVGDLAEILEDVREPNRTPRRGLQMEPIQAAGRFFRVHALHGERFEE